jgi:thiamine-monophosphate kinase
MSTLGPGREFDAIRALVRAWGRSASGIGDDAAVLDVPRGMRLVTSTDTSVADVHFRHAWLSADEIGWRATMAALSDLAAMGASPLGVLVAVSLPPERWSDLPALGHGIGAAVHEAGTVIVGGDTTRSATLSLTITVLGAAARPLARSGAQPGDAIWVTGVLGGPGRALEAWQQGRVPASADRARFARPVARLAAGRWLAANGATAAIDISDGLLADLAHVAHASGVRCCVHLDDLPCVAGAATRAVAVSGEEYELLVTAPRTLDLRAFASAIDLPLTCIGHVEAGAPEVVVDAAGVRVEITGGYDHLSG